MAYSGLGATYPYIITVPPTLGTGYLAWGTDTTTLYVDNNANTIFGSNTGSQGFYAESNVAVGAYSIASVNPVEGGGNVALGNNTLFGITTGSANLALGQGSGAYYAGTESNNILLNNPGIVGDSGAIRIGSSANQTYCNIAGIQGVTPTNGPTQAVIIGTDGQLGSTSSGGGSITLNGNTGSAAGSTVTVQTDTSKTTSYFSGSGSTLQMEFSDSNGNLIFGSTGASRSGTNNAVLGTNALANSTGNENCCLGFNAGVNVTSGHYSIMIGAYSGYFYTGSESNNISLNAQGPAGENHTLRIGTGSGTGDFQLSKAYIAGIQGVTPSMAPSNVVVIGSDGQLGSFPDTDNNVLLGGYPSSTFGIQNSGVGSGVLGALNNATGSYNSALGYYAGGQLQSGKLNSLIGFAAGYNYTSSESYNACINAQGTAGDNSVLRLGDSTGTSDFQFSSAYMCGVTGVGVTGSPVLVSSSNQFGVSVSSERFKKDIEDMGDTSDVIHALKPRTFVWNKESIPGLKDASESRQFGLIAEEVESVLPGIVNKDAEGKPFNINYQDLITPLLNEVQKLTKRITALETKSLCRCGQQRGGPS